MARTYEYWTVKDGEDIAVNLIVVSFSASKGNFSLQAADPDEYHGHCEIEWESKDDTSFMTESEIASMEEWRSDLTYRLGSDLGAGRKRRENLRRIEGYRTGE